MENTARVAEMCKLEMVFSKRYAPVYRVPAEKIGAVDLDGKIARIRTSNTFWPLMTE